MYVIMHAVNTAISEGQSLPGQEAKSFVIFKYLNACSYIV